MGILEIILLVFAIILIIAGLLGIIIPILPDLPLVWLGIFIYAAVGSFEKISLTLVLVFLALALLSFALDYLANIWGAKKYGASKWGIIGAVVGLVFGFLGGLPGIIFGPFIGAVAFELVSGRSRKKAIKIGVGTLIGFVVSIAFKYVLALVMIGFFVASFF